MSPLRPRRRIPARWLQGALVCAATTLPAAAQVADDLGDLGTDSVVVTPQQKQAVEHGLEWLAANQSADGSWIARIGYKLMTGYEYTAADKGHVGVTALAGMAFLAGGHLPGRGRYGPTVDRALDFVLSCVQPDGYITHAGSRMYSHAFATLFLAEIYGMTHRRDVREKLQLAVDFVVSSQNADGGWRYEPYAVESDISIVVCQVLALRAARNIGIRVPKAVVDKAARYVVDSAVTAESAERDFGSRVATKPSIRASATCATTSPTSTASGATTAAGTTSSGTGTTTGSRRCTRPAPTRGSRTSRSCATRCCACKSPTGTSRTAPDPVTRSARRWPC
jgi:hypothetical protein